MKINSLNKKSIKVVVEKEDAEYLFIAIMQNQILIFQNQIWNFQHNKNSWLKLKSYKNQIQIIKTKFYSILMKTMSKRSLTQNNLNNQKKIILKLKTNLKIKLKLKKSKIKEEC